MINFSSRKTGAPVEWGKATIPPKMGKSAKSAMTDSFIERIKAYAFIRSIKLSVIALFALFPIFGGIVAFPHSTGAPVFLDEKFIIIQAYTKL